MSISLSAFTEELRDLYANGALYEPYVAQFKTADELCMIKASAAARQPQRFKEDVRNGIPFRALFIDQNYAQAAYLHEEIKFYELLMINAADGEMPGGVDFVWINDDVESCELAKEFKRNAALLEKSCIGTSSPKPCCLVILDPFLCSFSVERSLLFETPAESPVAALSSAISSIKPGSLETWNHAINSFNKSMASNDTAPFDTREILLLEQAHETSSIKYSCWLPTDFYVNRSGSVTIRSYVNNLHPVQHAGLYECISKAFAKFVPLLEQVATDVLHPPKPRTVFDQEDWYIPGMLHPDAIIEMDEAGNEP
ncbi:hypothetical protein H4218_002270 [Coemansia sp. IMI 209128]|nr:hypothetical protein H4218_002270 [Coemansia sp. IMI 209128]